MKASKNAEPCLKNLKIGMALCDIRMVLQRHQRLLENLEDYAGQGVDKREKGGSSPGSKLDLQSRAYKLKLKLNRNLNSFEKH